MKFIFLMDPLNTVVMEKDTTFILMLGAYQRGHDVYFLPTGGITRKNGTTFFHVKKVIPQQLKKNPFIVKEAITLAEKTIDAVFIRTDPPFDYQYLMNTWLLDRLSSEVTVINAATGIRTVNEKIWATQFTSLIPPTIVGRNRDDLLQFLEEEGEVVAKPTDGYGGKAVFHLRKGDKNVNVTLETLTNHLGRDIILQKYVPEAKNGDKRILLLNGEPLGAVLRVNSGEDHRNNFFSGGKPVQTQITARDQEIIETLKPELQKLGLSFVGIDIMGDYLIEVNVTSPTCLQEINRLTNQQLEIKVIAFVEKLVEQNKSQAKMAT